MALVPVDDVDEDPLWDMVEQALAAELLPGTETTKIERKIRDHFRRGAKSLNYEMKGWEALIQEYAGAVFRIIFSALESCEWLLRIDFLLVFDLAVKMLFPPNLLRGVPTPVYERVVLDAHDRAVEEERFLQLSWTVVSWTVNGEKTKKRVYNAVGAGWRAARPAGQGRGAAADTPATTEELVRKWVHETIARLARESQGDPGWYLPREAAPGLFFELVKKGALNAGLVGQRRPFPPTLQFVEAQVHRAYQDHSCSEQSSGGRKSSSRGQGGGQAWKRHRGGGGQDSACPW